MLMCSQTAKAKREFRKMANNPKLRAIHSFPVYSFKAFLTFAASNFLHMSLE